MVKMDEDYHAKQKLEEIEKANTQVTFFPIPRSCSRLDAALLCSSRAGSDLWNIGSWTGLTGFCQLGSLSQGRFM